MKRVDGHVSRNVAFNNFGHGTRKEQTKYPNHAHRIFIPPADRQVRAEKLKGRFEERAKKLEELVTAAGSGAVVATCVFAAIKVLSATKPVRLQEPRLEMLDGKLKVR